MDLKCQHPQNQTYALSIWLSECWRFVVSIGRHFASLGIWMPPSISVAVQLHLHACTTPLELRSSTNGRGELGGILFLLFAQLGSIIKMLGEKHHTDGLPQFKGFKSFVVLAICVKPYVLSIIVSL